MSPEPQNPKHKRSKPDERINELEAQLAEAQKVSDQYLTQFKYAKADLDNLQKQTQKRIEEATDRAAARVLGELLTIADELTIIASTNDTRADALNMTLGKLNKLLEAEGVRPIEACGKPFDPYKHEAILEVETSEESEGTVVEEIRRGYTYKDKVLRASMVKVARAPSTKETPRDV